MASGRRTSGYTQSCYSACIYLISNVAVEKADGKRYNKGMQMTADIGNYHKIIAGWRKGPG
jgi:hypothetical protein